jgi:hypothetical protein
MKALSTQCYESPRFSEEENKSEKNSKYLKNGNNPNLVWTKEE